ncbi:MAG: ApbE-like protein lipoprotein [uncultured bacterium]|nr:MAG: ApbE-like protein lipoprotein [uncultured bacterium]
MDTSKRRLALIGFCIIAILAVILIRSAQQKRLFKESRTALYTMVSITVLSSSEEKARKAINEAYEELERLGRLLNFYADDSELSLINKNAGVKPVQVSKDTLEIIQAAIFAGDETEGGFDVTVGPIVKLWDFNKKTLPTAALVEEILPLVGYKNIVVDGPASTVYLKKAGVQIDLGGIIKGFAADKAVEILKKNGIDDGIVAVAGDIRTFGRQPDGKPWRIGIQNPRQEGDDDQLLATVDLATQGISTSGDYQRFFIEDGVRYHHLLNPKTGFPERLCRSVTVIAPTATMTDAFATGIFILGPEKGLAALKRLGMDGVIVADNGQILMTDTIKHAVHLIRAE